MADEVEQQIETTRQGAIDGLAHAGNWLSGAQRLDVWVESRLADQHPLDRARRGAVSPSAVPGAHESSALLSAAAVDVVHRIASDPGRLTRPWAADAISKLGEGAYTELIGVTAIARTIDTFSMALGSTQQELPEPRAGEPDQMRPDDVGDVGAWVPQTIGKSRANVSRALSLIPFTDVLWRGLVDSHYSRGRQFMELTWNRALTRVQVEAVAARTTIALDCFY